MRILLPLAAVTVLFLAGFLGAAAGLWTVFGVVVPYLALAVFLGGLTYRVLGWARIPVPFRIPTTCGQEKALPWIKHARFDNPADTVGVVGRMALEVLCFRSLLRNTKSELHSDGRLTYASSPWLWFGALAFHWSFLVIVVRHLRLFVSPLPAGLSFLAAADGFLEVGVPVFYATTIIFIAALAFLLLRRLADPKLRYLSLAADYFPLFLLLGIGLSGFCLRHLFKTDFVAVKELALGLVSFRPTVPAGISPLFFGHLFLVCTLLVYIPFSKLTHLAGVFLSPTRNLANNSRAVRHVNPWDYPVKVHTYEEYEDEFRDKMKAAGVPVEKE